MTDGRKQRRDAVANKERILTAAEAAFRTHGLSVDMRAVAAAAGVGVGTLYRHFPTREDLLQAITGSDLDGLADAGLADHGTAAEALGEFFSTTLQQLLASKAMIDLLAGADPSETELERCVSHLKAVGQQAVDRSAVDHTLAPDVTPEDIAYQLLALIRIAQLVPDPAVLEHHVMLALRGLVTAPAAPTRAAARKAK